MKKNNSSGFFAIFCKIKEVETKCLQDAGASRRIFA
jgi:hypothetical protein